MIQLTRLNSHPLVVNSDLIKFVEQAPDTVITLVNGDKIVVRESAQDVLERVVQFRRSVLQGIAPWSETSPALPPVVQNNVQNNVHDNVHNNVHDNANSNAIRNAEGNGRGKNQDQAAGGE